MVGAGGGCCLYPQPFSLLAKDAAALEMGGDDLAMGIALVDESAHRSGAQSPSSASVPLKPQAASSTPPPSRYAASSAAAPPLSPVRLVAAADHFEQRSATQPPPDSFPTIQAAQAKGKLAKIIMPKFALVTLKLRVSKHFLLFKKSFFTY